MYQAFIVAKMLLDLRNVNSYQTGNKFDTPLSRYIENCALYKNIKSIAGDHPDAVRNDFISDYASNITPKETSPELDVFSYFLMGSTNTSTAEILALMGDPFYYEPAYSGDEPCVSVRKWYDLVGNNEQFLKLINIKRWRIGLLNAQVSGRKITQITNTGGEIIETFFDFTNGSLVNIKSLYNLSVTNNGDEFIRQEYYENLELVFNTANLPDVKTEWAKAFKVIFSEKNADSSSGLDEEIFDSHVIELSSVSQIFTLQSPKPVVSNGESGSTQFIFRRGVTEFPEYTISELITLMNVPY